MALKAASRRAQRGAALLVMMAIVVMGVSYMLVDRLGAANRSVVRDRERNARVLSQAKQALIGWVAINAGQTDNNPGRLPCPEAVNSIGTDSEGISAPLIAPATPNCATVGRLPWRTLGLEKLVDADAEPLWFVVSPGWALQNSSTLLTINSDSLGSLVVDGAPAPNDVVALIIAPGQAMNVAATGSCTARTQARNAPAPGMDPRDYIECFNSATPAFSTVGPTTSFNDQVLKVTTSDLLPAIEAAIAHRMEREIVPALRGVYGSAQWNTTAANPLFPFATPFANPGTSNYKGADGTYQGLLPLTNSETSPGSGVPCAAGARCDPLFVAWTSGTLSGSASIKSPSCAVVTGATTRLDCTFNYTCSLLLCSPPTLNYTIQAQAAKVGMSLRQINMSAPIGSANVTASLDSASAVFSSNGSASLTLTGTMTPNGSGGFLSALLGNSLCGLPLVSPLLGCKPSLISVPIGVLADHPVLDAGDATYGWFVRNEWYRLTYYAAAQANTANGLGAFGCTTATNCLRLENPALTENKRALLVLAGRSINGSARPSATLADYLEFGNSDNGTRYEQNPVSRVVGLPKAPFNDRVMIVDSN